MLISVVIPHFNQPEYLRTCLTTLDAQRGDPHAVEIIVVDNGSHISPDQICAAFAGVRLLGEDAPGPGPARNRGAAAASGDIIAFIDADCFAHEGWLAAIKKAFSDPETNIIGGDVQVGRLDPARPTFLELYEGIYAYRNDQYIARGFSGTGNLAVRAEVLRSVGPFAGISVAEDRDWGRRATKMGYKINYAQDMIVYHPARRSFADLKGKWDRHISHEYQAVSAKRLGTLRWLARSVAIAGSPLFELGTILRTPRLSGARERSMAWLCLIRIRLYRAYAMIRHALNANARSARNDWTRSR